MLTTRKRKQKKYIVKPETAVADIPIINDLFKVFTGASYADRSILCYEFKKNTYTYASVEGATSITKTGTDYFFNNQLSSPLRTKNWVQTSKLLSFEEGNIPDKFLLLLSFKQKLYLCPFNILQTELERTRVKQTEDMPNKEYSNLNMSNVSEQPQPITNSNYTKPSSEGNVRKKQKKENPLINPSSQLQPETINAPISRDPVTQPETINLSIPTNTPAPQMQPPIFNSETYNPNTVFYIPVIPVTVIPVTFFYFPVVPTVNSPSPSVTPSSNVNPFSSFSSTDPEEKTTEKILKLMNNFQ